MRKFTTFVVALLAFAGATSSMADTTFGTVAETATTSLTNGAYYVIKLTGTGSDNSSTSGYMYRTSANIGYFQYQLTNDITLGSKITNESAAVWQYNVVDETAGTFSLTNAYYGLVLPADAAASAYISSSEQANLVLTDAGNIYQTNYTVSGGNLRLNETDENYTLYLGWKSAGVTYSSWSNDIATFEFYYVEPATTIDVTYNYYLDNATTPTYSETVAATIGDSYPSPTLPSYVTSSTNTIPTTVVTDSEGQSYDITCTSSTMPFEEDNWYFLRLGNGETWSVGGYLYDYTINDASATYMTLGSSYQSKTLTNYGSVWAFNGDPFNGFQIYTLSGKYLSAPTTGYDSNTGGNVHPVLTDLADVPEGNMARWDITPSSDITTLDSKTVTGFYIGLHGYSDYRMNDRDNILSFWTTGAGKGSTFTVSQDIPAISLTSVNGNYYATTCLPFNVTTTGDATAYTATVDGTVMKLTETTTMYANKGYVLEGAATYTADLANDQTSTGGETALSGTTTDIDITDSQSNYLVLGRSSAGNVGFYKPSTSVTTIPANKAYYDNTSSSANGLSFSFSDELTGIESVTTTEAAADAPAYDLSGRTVKNPTKGLYIRNGKKIYIK